MTELQRRRLVARKLSDLHIPRWVRRIIAGAVDFCATHHHISACVVLGGICALALAGLGAAGWLSGGVFVASILAGLAIEIKAEWRRAER